MSNIVPLFVNGVQVPQNAINFRGAFGIESRFLIEDGLRRVAIGNAHGIDMVMHFGHPTIRNSQGQPLLVSTHPQPLYHAVISERDEMENLRNILETDCSYQPQP